MGLKQKRSSHYRRTRAAEREQADRKSPIAHVGTDPPFSISFCSQCYVDPELGR